MRGWKLLIVASAALAALAVGVGAQAAPQADDLQTLITMLGSSFG